MSKPAIKAAEAAEAFKWEQGECIDRLRLMITAVQSGDVYEINRAFDSVKASVRYLNDNDPRRAK
jgi:hypothetical protein